ncbi:hypothetical protein DFJ67_2179 [Asanoa ferruginea]|uniref:Uncharacterized protein n=1 Tax=Asanoa ferruginea TaxID=53367 RepID=A0A3D9ZJV6_9ACTN|nr:hypothetical protein [Asanoa ferruginea]REF96203.1 hypothetical protein DFJ67_2179 [Asanoa ferruginea]GIF49357.1 hypothetical protein Afe04nite_38960 [Asanoa ferruginea]
MDPLALLAAPGERLGWTFDDRNLRRQPFAEPEPVRGTVPPHLRARAARWQQGMLRRILISVGVGGAIAAVLFLCGGTVLNLTTAGWIAFSVIGLLLLLAGAVVGGLVALPAIIAARMATAAERTVERDYARARAGWDERRRAHDREQQETVDRLPEWRAAAPVAGNRRIDIVGGTAYGWEAVLTVFGGSLLATRGPMLLVDFTGDALCGELMRLAASTGRTVGVRRFPAELARLDLVTGLSAGELVDCLVEAIHGDARQADRAERSEDALLLHEICDVLAPDFSMPRLLGALHAFTDRPAPALSDDERTRLRNTRSDDRRRLRRIEAFLHPLGTMGTEPSEPTTADLFCLIADEDTGGVQQELLKELLVQWLARQLRVDAPPMGSLVLVGADGIHHRSIERLSTLCERRGVRLVLLFAHLREESLRTIGGGEVALMRLGNHREATEAADFVGKGHRFVVSQLTRTLGGNEAHTVAESHGAADMLGVSEGHLRFTQHHGVVRDWSRTVAHADGTNWSDAEATQRVYEYAVEPRVLQDLPDHALLLVRGDGQGEIVQAVEVDPAIVTLPRVAMD